MKKVLLTLICAFLSLVGMAQSMDFTGDLSVSLGGAPVGMQKKTVTMSLNPDGTGNFAMEDFVFSLAGTDVPVGSLYLNSFGCEIGESTIAFSYGGGASFQNGNPAVSPYWVGPTYGEVDINFYGSIDIATQSLVFSMDIVTSDAAFSLNFKNEEQAEEGSKKYTDVLTVVINGDKTVAPNTTVLYKDNGDGTCNFTLKNFTLSSEDTTIPVGNISVPNMPLTKGEGTDTFSFEGVIAITDGDADAIPEPFEMWFGPLMFSDGLFVTLSGKVSEDKAYVTIDIDLTEELGQIIGVEFGSDDFDAKKYTDELAVVINGDKTVVPNTTVLYKDNGDGTCNFTLKNFTLSSEDTTIPVGNISVPNMPLTKGDDFDTFSFEGVIAITDGDADAIPEPFEMWFGPLMFSDGLFVTLSGKVSEDKAYVTIDIDLTEELGQIIGVQFGSDFAKEPELVSTKTFVDNVRVVVGDSSKDLTDQALVMETYDDGTCAFVVKNFILSYGGMDYPVGNVVVRDVEPIYVSEDVMDIKHEGKCVVESGDKDALPAGSFMWVGPMLFPDGAIVSIGGVIVYEKARLTLVLDLTSIIGEVVTVDYGIELEKEPELVRSYSFVDNMIVTNDCSKEYDNNQLIVDLYDNDLCTITLKNLFVPYADGTEITLGDVVLTDVAPIRYEDGTLAFKHECDAVLDGNNARVTVYGELRDDNAALTFYVDTKPGDDHYIQVFYGSDLVDGISSVAQQSGKGNVIYDLSGRRVQNAGRGLYIINGKKVLK